MPVLNQRFFFTFDCTDFASFLKPSLCLWVTCAVDFFAGLALVPLPYRCCFIDEFLAFFLIPLEISSRDSGHWSFTSANNMLLFHQVLIQLSCPPSSLEVRRYFHNAHALIDSLSHLATARDDVLLYFYLPLVPHDTSG